VIVLARFLHSDPDPAVVFLKKGAIAVLAIGTAFSIVMLAIH